jgi:hypothetical protein
MHNGTPGERDRQSEDRLTGICGSARLCAPLRSARSPNIFSFAYPIGQRNAAADDQDQPNGEFSAAERMPAAMVPTT